MKLPYSKLELQVALLGLNQKKFTEEKVREIEEEFKAIRNSLAEKKDRNKAIAEYHGITVVELLNSQNYQILCEEYGLSLFEEVIQKMVEKFEITEKQAWAMIAMSMGLLD